METITNIQHPVSSIQILPIREKQSTDNYPYGRLRTTAYFSIEFVPGKGFRHVFQTVNPKNGRLNAEKKSTYSHFMYLVRNNDNGHYETRGFGIGGFEDINKLCRWMNVNLEAVDPTEEMIKDICCTIITAIRISARWVSADAGKVLPLLDTAMRAALEGFKTGVCRWQDVWIDTAAIERLEEEKKETKNENELKKIA